MNVILILSATLAINVLVGLSFFIRNKSHNKIQSFTFGLFYLSLNAWILSLIMISVSTPIFWTEVSFIAGPMLMFSLALFAHLFPKPSKNLKWWHLSYAIPIIVYTLLVAIRSDLFVYNVVSVNNQIDATLGPLYFFHVLLVTIYPIVALSVLFYKMFKATNLIIKTQLKYVLAGICFTIGFGVFTNVVLPAFGIFYFNLIAPVVTIPLVISTTYAITRYRFLDLQFVFQKVLTYSTITLLATGLVLVFVRQDSPLFYLSNQVLSSIIFIIAILYFNTIFNFFQKLYTKLLPGQQKCKEVLSSLTSSIVNTLNLNEIADLLNQNVRTALAVNNEATLFIPQNASEITANEKPLMEFFSTHSGGLAFEEIELHEGEGHTSQQNYEDLKDSFNSFDASFVLPLKKDDDVVGLYIIKKTKQADATKHLISVERLKHVEKFLNQIASTAISNAKKYQQLKQTVDTEENQDEDLIKSLYHEFNTPLTVIKGNLELLQMEMEPQKVDEISSLADEIDKVTKTTNTLIELSSLRKNKNNLTFKALNLSHLIDRIIGELYSKNKSFRKIKVKHKINDHIIKGASSLIEKLFHEVLQNAFFYATKKVEISYKTTGNELQINISDDGPGIDKKNLPYVFDTFYRVDKSRTKATGGTGLGLSIAKAIAERHHGGISIQSVKDESTSVSISLPFESDTQS
ncbi:ATP-binding protein [Patescibacteria group bacterium]